MLRIFAITFLLLQPCAAYAQLVFPAIAAGQPNKKVHVTAAYFSKYGDLKASKLTKVNAPPPYSYVSKYWGWAERSHVPGTVGISDAYAHALAEYVKPNTVGSSAASTECAMIFTLLGTHDRMVNVTWLNSSFSLNPPSGGGSLTFKYECVSGPLSTVWTNTKPGTAGAPTLTTYYNGTTEIETISPAYTFNVIYWIDQPLPPTVTISANHNIGGYAPQSVVAKGGGNIKSYLTGYGPAIPPNAIAVPKPGNWPSGVTWPNPIKFELWNQTDFPKCDTASATTYLTQEPPDEGTDTL